MPRKLTRRHFLAAATAALAAANLRCASISVTKPGRPILLSGIQSGDVTDTSAMIWSAADRAGRMIVDWDTTESFANARRVVGPDGVTRSGFTAKVDLTNLPPGQRIVYRVRFENLDDATMSEALTGSFTTAPREARDLRIIWSGDTAGQGWGIDTSQGGMPIYSAMTKTQPDLFIHSGDTIYADVPILPEVRLDDGRVWRNVTTPAKSRVAQTVDDFRGNYAYNLLDANVRRFNANVPILAQWDDHEVRNNWYPGQRIEDEKYAQKDASILAMHGRQAFLEYFPIRRNEIDPNRIFRRYLYGPLLEIFIVDERSYRGRNSANKQDTLDSASAFLGPPQLEWLKQSLKQSMAVWKLIASDMPLSAVARDGSNFEAWANADAGAPLGRELELASLLSFVKSHDIRNTVWITADVHYAANIHYHPDRAPAFKEFLPFWEFISGPLHAGGFGPNALDKTFGAEYRWKNTPRKSGDGPGHGYGHFGMMTIDAKSRAMRITQHGIDGRELANTVIEPS